MLETSNISFNSDTPNIVKLETYEKSPLMRFVSYYFQLEGLACSALTKAEYKAFLKIANFISNEGIEYMERCQNVSD